MINFNDLEVDKGLEYLIANEMNKAGSDKFSRHNYPVAYSYFISRLPSIKNINLLEIGIAISSAQYSSLHGWSRIFPESNIIGMDIDPNRMININNISSYTADQGNPIDLEKFISDTNNIKFNIILDDGSHWLTDSTTTFNYMFERLSPNGIYMIEDVRKHPPESNFDGDIQQTINQWSRFLKTKDSIEWEMIDCRPDLLHDDSVVIGIWKK